MESILEAWRKARDSTKLAQNMQQLIKDFENSFRLLREESTLLERESLSRKIIEREREILSIVLQDFLVVEIEKSILSDTGDADYSKMFNIIRQTAQIKGQIKKIVDILRTGNQIDYDFEDLFQELIKNKYRLLVAKSDIEQFIGVDGRKHGPAKMGDLITIPVQDSEILISENLAESVE